MKNCQFGIWRLHAWKLLKLFDRKWIGNHVEGGLVMFFSSVEILCLLKHRFVGEYLSSRSKTVRLYGVKTCILYLLQTPFENKWLMKADTSGIPHVASEIHIYTSISLSHSHSLTLSLYLSLTQTYTHAHRGT